MDNSRRTFLSEIVLFAISLTSILGYAAPPAQSELNWAALTVSPNTLAQNPGNEFEQEALKSAKEAESLLQKGEKRISKGENRLADGREQVEDGEKLIQKGSDRLQESRDRYRTISRAIGSANSPNEVFDEAKQLKKIGGRWEDAIDDKNDGEKLVKKGNKTIAKAQDEIREGRELVAASAKIKRQLERDRQLRDRMNDQSGNITDR